MNDDGTVELGGSFSGVSDTDYNYDISATPFPYDSEEMPGFMDDGGGDFGDFLDSFMQWYTENQGGVDLMSLSPSTSSYLSTTQLDLFDRILSGGDYRYYIAYRTGSDTYNAVLYACDEVSVNGSLISLISPMQFQLYRTYSGNTYYYYYTHSQLASDSVSLSSNILYYTNIVDGYPLLANQGNNDIKFSKENLILLGVVLLVLILVIGRRRKHV